MTPGANLSLGTHSITATATDAAGNVGALSGELDITIEQTAPTLSRSSPSDDATNFGRTSNIAMDFSENVYAGTGTILLRTGSTTVETFNVATGIGDHGGTVTISGTTVVLNPGITLSSSTVYNINVASTALQDIAGNTYGGITGTTTFNFTTGTGNDVTAPSAPTLTSVTDDVGSITGPLANNASTDDTALVVRVGLTGTGALLGDTIQLYNGATPIGAPVILSYADINTAGFKDITTPALTDGTTYTLTAKVIDAAGNASAASASKVFTVDTAAPAVAIDSVTANNDVSEAEDVSGFHITGTATGASGQSITVQILDPSNANSIVASQVVTVSGGGTWDATFANPALTGGGHHYTAHASVADVAGNLGALDHDFTSTACFMAGTLVRTPAGEVAVETLKRGDSVITSDGRVVPIDWLGRQTISTVFADPLRVLPIRIKAGALDDNVPVRDLLISPDHALLVDGVLVQAGRPVNGSSIVREVDVPEVFTYYHVEVDDHSLVLANNTPAETFIDNIDRLGFDNWAEHQALYPEGRSVKEMPYPRAKAQRQLPSALRKRLAKRETLVSGDVSASAA